MPRIINAGVNPNIVKIEPSPYKKCSVKVKMEVLNVAGGSPKFTTNEKGDKKYQTIQKDPKNLTRLPGTIVMYTAALSGNGLVTGLDEIVDNPYKELDFYKPGWSDILKGNKKIRRQELLEYKHGKDKGYYTNQVSDVMASKLAADAPFYQRSESRVLLNDGVTYLDLNNPIHEANYYMLRAHKNVSLSFDELKINSRATHYIVDETERSTRDAEDVRKTHKFGARLEEIMSLNDNVISDFCKALNIKIKGTTQSDSYSAINDYVSRNDDNYEEFMGLYDLWKDVATREIFEGYVELFDLLSIPGLITIRTNKLFWSQPSSDGGKKESWEWKSKDQFIRQFLIDPRYQEEVSALREQYRSKTRY